MRVPFFENISLRFLEKVNSSPACFAEVLPNKRRFESECIEPYSDWAFCYLKRLGGGGDFLPPPNSANSSQITMKLEKDILWVKSLQIDKIFL